MVDAKRRPSSVLFTENHGLHHPRDFLPHPWSQWRCWLGRTRASDAAAAHAREILLRDKRN